MKKRIFLLIIFISCIPYIKGEEYQLKSGKIYYKERENAQEISVIPEGTIPSDTVFVRMHERSKTNDKFEVSNSKGEEFIGSAPKTWPGKKLLDCIRPKDEQPGSGYPPTGTAIPMGTKHFHYLFAFVSQFDDSFWESFPYDSNDSIKMQQALNKLQEQLAYLPGKQYLLAQQSTTKWGICNCMDSILQNAGEGDMVFLFLSGHGEKDNADQFHFITKDARKDAYTRGFSNSLTKSEINKYINDLTSKKARVVFFMDACYAGEMEDKTIRGDVAYYFSTNSETQAYYNSPFAKALMNVMSGTIDNKESFFKENQVKIGSLGIYFSKIVYDNNSVQLPSYYIHGFKSDDVLWKLPSAPMNKDEHIEKIETNTLNYTYKYPFSARSFIPGWQQIYKGSTGKGVGIICAEAVGVAGIITSFSIKAYNEKLMKTDPKHVQEYSSRVKMCQYFGYVSIAATAGVYIYNIIDAAVAPGKKPILVDKEITFAPSMTLDGSICLTMNYKF